METFDDQLQNVTYHKTLDQNWQKYIDTSIFQMPAYTDQEFIISEMTVKPSHKDMPFEIDLRIEGGEIFYHISCNRLNELQASELRFKIALAISRSGSFKELRFSVSLINSNVPMILIRLDAKSDEEELAYMVKLLEEVIERSKLSD